MRVAALETERVSDFVAYCKKHISIDQRLMTPICMTLNYGSLRWMIKILHILRLISRMKL
jgi:hypothetical protein